MCFVFIWEQTATCATYGINWLVFITEMKSVYCAVRTGSLNKAVCASSVKGQYSRYLVMSNRICYLYVYIFRRSQHSSFNPSSCPDTTSTTEASNVLLETERSLDLKLKISTVRFSLPQNGVFIDRSTKFELLNNYLAHSIGTLFYSTSFFCHFPSVTQCVYGRVLGGLCLTW